MVELAFALARALPCLHRNQALTIPPTIALGGFQGGVNALPTHSTRYECCSKKHLCSGASGHALLLAVQQGCLAHAHSLAVNELLETNTLRTTMSNDVQCAQRLRLLVVVQRSHPIPLYWDLSPGRPYRKRLVTENFFFRRGLANSRS